jgi:PTS system mannose-specific IIA component
VVGCILLTHGDLGSGLKDTLEGIMGRQKGLAVISNVGLGKEELISALQQCSIDQSCEDGVVIFVDMFGTSCWQTAKKVASNACGGQKKIAVITGVNLPMLVKFFSLRDSLSVDELVPLLKQEGEAGIRIES